MPDATHHTSNNSHRFVSFFSMLKFVGWHPVGASALSLKLYTYMSSPAPRSPSVAQTILDVSDSSDSDCLAADCSQKDSHLRTSRSRSPKVLFDFPRTPPEEWYKLNDDSIQEPESPKHVPNKVSSTVAVRHEIRYVDQAPQHAHAFLHMSLATKKHLVPGMILELPDCIRSEAEARLHAVMAVPDILIMGDKCPSAFAKQVVTIGKPFYVGITERPLERMIDHRSSGFFAMALWMFESSRGSAAREKSLIREFRATHLLLNVGPGGERASAATPHFLYIVVKKS